MNVPKLRFKEFDGEVKKYKIKEVFNVQTGLTPLRSNLDYFSPKYISWIKTLDLNDSLIYETEEHVSELALSKTSLKIVPPNTVLIAMYGGFNQIGRTGLTTVEATTNQAISALIPNENMRIHPYFIQTYLNAHKNYWKSLAASSRKDPNITKKDIEKFSISIPEFLEQQKLGEFFGLLNKKIQLQQQKIDLLQEQKKGYMQKIFNQELRFEDGNVQDYQEWISEKLYHIAEINKGTQLNKNLLSKIRTTEQIYPVYNGGISPSGFTSVNNRVKDNIIISEGGNSCGYVNYIKEDFYSGGHSYTILLKNNEINKKFLYYYLKYKENHIMALRVGSGLPNIQKSALSNFDIHYPNISEQLRITEFLSIFEKKIQYEEIKVSKLIEQKKGFIQQMFI